MTELKELVQRQHQASAVGTLTYILFGLILWGLQLSAVYGGHTLICTSGLAGSLSQVMVLAVTAVAALVLFAFLIGQHAAARLFGLRDDTAGRRTYDRLSRIIGMLAMVAIIWTGGTALVVASCLQAR
jgi:hypothetical protein